MLAASAKTRPTHVWSRRPFPKSRRDLLSNFGHDLLGALRVPLRVNLSDCCRSVAQDRSRRLDPEVLAEPRGGVVPQSVRMPSGNNNRLGIELLVLLVRFNVGLLARTSDGAAVAGDGVAVALRALRAAALVRAGAV